MKMSKFESELQQAVDKFVNYPGKHASTAYPMALAKLNRDLRLCLDRLDSIVNSFNSVEQQIYRTTEIEIRTAGSHQGGSNTGA